MGIFAVYFLQMNTERIESENMTFGKKLRQLRLKHLMSQKELGLLVHVTAQAVSKWEHDLSEPEFRVVKELAAIFKISVDQLFSLESAGSSTGIVFTGKKADSMRQFYGIITLFLSGLLVSFLVLTVFTYQLDQLPRYYPIGFGVAFGITLFAEWYIADARFNFLATPDPLLKVYGDRIVLINRTSIPIDSKLKFRIVPYRAIAGIGLFTLQDPNGTWWTVRDIEHINKLGALLSQLHFERKVEEDQKK